MYATTPYWTFSARRPARRLPIAVRKIALALGALAIAVFALAQTAAGEGPSGPAVYRVKAGDTLWSIAASRYQGADVRQKVLDLESVNKLTSPSIYPGETLKLP